MLGLGLGRAGQGRARQGGAGQCKTIKSHNQSMVAKGSI